VVRPELQYATSYLLKPETRRSAILSHGWLDRCSILFRPCRRGGDGFGSDTRHGAGEAGSNSMVSGLAAVSTVLSAIGQLPTYLRDEIHY
jgi:hypothetical protein